MATISIGGFDLYPYTRILAGEGMDVADTDFIEPNFGDTSSNFGDPLLSVKKNNREVVIPIHLRSANKTKSGLHTILIQLNTALRTGKVLTWQDDGATAASYLSVQFARFEPEFNKRRQDAGWMSGVVRIFTGPYARSVASGYATALTPSAGVNGVLGSIALPSMSLSDGPLAYRIQINSPSQFGMGEGRIVGAAVLPPSYVADWSAASLLQISVSTLMGATMACGSQVLGKGIVNPNSFGTVDFYYKESFAQLILTNASAYSGNNRVLAVARSRFPAVGITITGENGLPRTPYSLPTSFVPFGFGVVDLGVVNIDPSNGATTVLTFAPVVTNLKQTSDITNVNRYPDDLQLNRVLILPEDTTQYVVDDNGRRPIGGFAPDPLDLATYVLTGGIDDYGNGFATAVLPNIASYPIIYNAFGVISVPTVNNGTTTYPAAVISNVPTSFNLSANLSANSLMNHAINVNGTQVISIGKYYGVGTAIIAARVAMSLASNAQTIATAALQIVSGGLGLSLGVASVIACSALSTTPSFGAFITAPGIHLRFQQMGPVISAQASWDTPVIVTASKGFVTASIVASIGEAAQPGVGIIGIDDRLQGINIHWWSFSEVPSTGIRAGDVYVLDGENQTAYRGVGQNYNVAKALRGRFIEHDPDADRTRYNAIVPFVLPLDNEPTNQDWSYKIDYNEHFTYAVI